jgi:hypothetical protein
MNDNTNEAGVTKGKPELIRIDEGEIRSHLDQIVRGTVEETLNALLEAEADAICKASRYERSPERTDTRARPEAPHQGGGSDAEGAEIAEPAL